MKNHKNCRKIGEIFKNLVIKMGFSPHTPTKNSRFGWCRQNVVFSSKFCRLNFLGLATLNIKQKFVPESRGSGLRMSASLRLPPWLFSPTEGFGDPNYYGRRRSKPRRWWWTLRPNRPVRYVIFTEVKIHISWLLVPNLIYRAGERIFTDRPRCFPWNLPVGVRQSSKP